MTVIIGFGWLGGLGAIVVRPSAIAVGIAGLFLLGFWQAVLWIVVISTAGLVLVAWCVIRSSEADNSDRRHTVEG